MFKKNSVERKALNEYTNNNFSETLLKLIKKRRSIRLFNGNKIPKEDILSIIEAGI